MQGLNLPSAARGQHQGTNSVALSEIDRNLLERCLQRKPRAWEDFVDRFMGLLIHVVNHTAQPRSICVTPKDRDDLCAEVFLNIVSDDFAVLRRFHGQSSLATYLTVVARRIVVKRIRQSRTTSSFEERDALRAAHVSTDVEPQPEQRSSDHEQVERLLDGLGERESKVAGMYYLEGKSYRETSQAAGVSENSVGPILSRARRTMRRALVKPAVS